MRVLSVRQPYAALLVLGPKRFEARVWRTPYRGPVLIHASSAVVTKGTIEDLCVDRALFHAIEGLGWTDDAVRGLPRSAIIGQVDLTDIVPSQECTDATAVDYDLASYPDDETFFWRVSNGVPIDPVPIGGKLNLWTLPEELEGRVVDGLDTARSRSAAWVSQSFGSGRPLGLILFRAVDELGKLLGGGPMTLQETLAAGFKYADERGLTSPRQVRLDDSLQFLAPGRQTLLKEDFNTAVCKFIERVG